MSKKQKCNTELDETAQPGETVENDSQIFLSHDGFFRHTFDQTVAESFIKEYLPQEITKNFDFSTLKKSH